MFWLVDSKSKWIENKCKRGRFKLYDTEFHWKGKIATWSNINFCVCIHVCACIAGNQNSFGNLILLKSKIFCGCIPSRDFPALEEKKAICKAWPNLYQAPSVPEALQGWCRGTGSTVTKASREGPAHRPSHPSSGGPISHVTREGWTLEWA